MKNLSGLAVVTLLLNVAPLHAGTLYVSPLGTNPVPPYTNWGTAAVTIQDAVDAAVGGDEIVVTNGSYATGARAVDGMSNRVAVTKAVTVRSVNGPEATLISGYQVPGTTNGATAIRCVYLANDATLSGFTLTNGATQASGDSITNQSGGGVWGLLTAVVSNCVLKGNSAFSCGGGAYLGTLLNCTLSRNSANYGGGAFYATLNNCTLTENSASEGGGAYGGTLYNCALSGNSASFYEGGAFYGAQFNCTLSRNSAYSGGGALYAMLFNCIVYYNSAVRSGDNYDLSTLDYCCTTPLPASGAGNLTNAPLFVDLAAGNLRLQTTSPCIDAGNNTYVVGSTDLDGNPRIFAGTVDLGAYECAHAETHYVSLTSSNPVWPYRSWATAATTIQAAVDAAVAGEQIVVSNGVYQSGATAVYGMSNRVAVTKTVTVRSLNGPEVTVIRGHYVPGTNNGPAAIRCVYLQNGATLSGFTLTNGATQVSGDVSTNQSGGGVWCEGSSAVVSNCLLRGNSASSAGGGAYHGTLNNCTLSRNSAYSGGGGFGGTLNNCSLTGNSAFFYGGGADSGTLNNCTLSGNSAVLFGGGADSGMLNNCIVYYNSASFGGANYRGSVLNYCCTTPLPSSGTGNFTSEPLFLAYAAGNLRLQSNSPCINAGINACVSIFTDLEGNPRIIAGTVDVGAYELQLDPFHAWLLQCSLPFDGSADFTDADADGMNNWQEWLCGTSPTNAASVLRLLRAAQVGPNVTVSWQSVAGTNYFLQRSRNLAPAGFRTIATDLIGQPGTTTYTDTNAARLAPLFYRAGVGNPPMLTTPNLASEWKFEGNTTDTSENGNDGTITGTPSYVPGRFGQAIYLNRADSIRKNGALYLPVAGTNSWSFNVWFYLTNAPDSLAYLCGFGDAGSQSSVGTARGLLAYSGLGNNGIYSWGANSDLATGQSYPLNDWTMVTITHDGVSGRRSIWIDASLAASEVFPLANTSSTILAGVTVWPDADFQGALDEFTVWSGVLGTNQIGSLFLNNDIYH